MKIFYKNSSSLLLQIMLINFNQFKMICNSNCMVLSAKNDKFDKWCHNLTNGVIIS